MKILIDGFGIVAQSVLRKLLDTHNVSPDNIIVNTYSSSENYPFKAYCLSRGINIFAQKYNDNSFLDKVTQFRPDILMSIYARRIIPQKLLDQINFKSFNFHPSLLPKYKGCFSCPWAIINEEKTTGITIHEIVEEIDAGQILFQKEIQINKNETAFSLYNKCALEFIINFDQFYLNLVSNSLAAQPMEPGGHYYPRKVPYDGFIDSSWPLQKIDAFIRAMHFPPHPAAILKHNSRMIEINSISEYIKFATL